MSKQECTEKKEGTPEILTILNQYCWMCVKTQCILLNNDGFQTEIWECVKKLINKELKIEHLMIYVCKNCQHLDKIIKYIISTNNTCHNMEYKLNINFSNDKFKNECNRFILCFQSFKPQIMEYIMLKLINLYFTHPVFEDYQVYECSNQIYKLKKIPILCFEEMDYHGPNLKIFEDFQSMFIDYVIAKCM